MADTVGSLLAEIASVGADSRSGGYSRPVYSPPELELRTWFVEHASRRGLDVETDRNGLIWAWHAGDGRVGGGVVTGSHLDSVPGGGAFDGPLGVASALVAFDKLQERGAADHLPRGIVVFPEEEGSRFGVACLGSRLLTGTIDPDRARALTDESGSTFAEVAAGNGLDPRHLGADHDSLARIGTFVELHVEQGRGLIDLDRPVGIATSIMGHGRWRLTITGQGNHAGTTLMSDRRDPVVAAAGAVTTVRAVARRYPDARATVGRLVPTPGGSNVIASRVDLWVDVRHPEDSVAAEIIAEIGVRSRLIAEEEGCIATLTEESLSPTVDFDAGLRNRLRDTLPDAPLLNTGAGHDAGILSATSSTAMLFVRNPTGISHSGLEHVEDADAESGALALADCLEHLLGQPSDPFGLG